MRVIDRGAAALAMAVVFATSPAMAEAEAFKRHADQLVWRLVVGTEALATAVEAGDLEAAKASWIAARHGWERGETFLAEYFPDHDEAIDFWPDAERGFHAIEPLLFEAGDVAAAGAPTTALLAEVHDLAALQAATSYDRQRLLDGTAGLVFEIGADKAEGGESPFAGTSLNDMRDNMIGIETTYALVFAAPLAEADPALHRTITAQLIALADALDVPALNQLDQPLVMQLSETLAVSFQDAAAPLGLKAPELGG